MIRVLVAEDSVTTRMLLVGILTSDPGVKIIGEASDGVEAVEKAKELRPDVVTMDIEMPLMDGFEATKRIMAESPAPIVIVSAHLDRGQVKHSMQALRAGALAVLPKPPGPDSDEFETQSRRLTDTVKTMAEVKVIRRWRRTDTGLIEPPPPVPAADNGARCRIIAVAVSTGGPEALHRILSELPPDFPVPMLVVQHIAPGFVGGLADWLNGLSSLRVKVAENGEALKNRTVYLAPDDRHLGAEEARIRLSTSAPIDGFRPSGTFLFESVARVYGSAAVAVILTGMGRDGVKGLKAVRERRGRVIAQDEKSSVVYGMPREARERNLVDVVLPLGTIASRIQEIV